MLEYAIIIVIVGLVLFLGGRSLYRNFTGEKPACSCGAQEGSCKIASQCSAAGPKRKSNG